MSKGVRNDIVPVPSWDEIESAFDPQFVADIRRTIAEKFPATMVGNGSVGPRHFLSWLGARTDPPSRAVVSCLSGRRDPGLTDARYLQMVVAAVRLWVNECRRDNRFGGSTLAVYGTRAANVLQYLGESGDRRYAPFQRRFITIAKDAAADVKSLGDLDWPELEGMRGAARERKALAMLRDDALQAFDAWHALFLFGQSVLKADSPPVDVDGEAWRTIKTLLDGEAACWRDLGRSQFTPAVDKPPELAAAYLKSLYPALWVAAGLPPKASALLPPRGKGSSKSVDRAVIGCIGPTLDAVLRMLTVFCCDTGWNRQTMCDLPRQPFLFETSQRTGLASSAFIESFKRRAGHTVLSYLERRQASPLAEDAIDETWRATVGECDPGDANDGHVILDRASRSSDGSLLAVFDRFQSMADAIRPFDRTGIRDDRFVICLSPQEGLGLRENIILSDVRGLGGVSTRDGVSFKAIRKSVLSMKLRDVGTVSAVRPIAGHSGTSVLMAHYLNSDDIKAELDESIRFFQNACQSLMVAGRDHASVRLGLPDGELEWFRRLAAVAGVSAAVGIQPAGDRRAIAGSLHAVVAPEPTEIRFDPTPDNLRDLFLTHWALRLCQRTAPAARWRVQALPLLAAVKAVGRTLMSKGLRQAYWKAARSAHHDVVSGKIALPLILDEA